MPRMRLLKDIYPYIKQIDPDTALTRTAIHRLVNEGKIPCEHVGVKKLINLDLLDRFLNGEDVSKGEMPIKAPQSGIRAVSVK